MVLWTTIGNLLQQPITSETDVHRLVQAGVPRKTFSTIERHLAIPKGVVASTATRRMRLKKKAARLTASESERLIGITRVFALADQLFGDGEAALAWMYHPAQFISGRAPVKPIELAVLPSGARFLKDRIRRTQHGM